MFELEHQVIASVLRGLNVLPIQFSAAVTFNRNFDLADDRVVILFRTAFQECNLLIEWVEHEKICYIDVRDAHKKQNISH